MDQQFSVAEGALDFSAGIFPSPIARQPQAAPRGTLAGTVLTIMALLLGYVGVGFARLLF